MSNASGTIAPPIEVCSEAEGGMERKDMGKEKVVMYLTDYLDLLTKQG